MAISIHQTFKEQTKSWLATWMYVQLSVWLTTPFLAYHNSDPAWLKWSHVIAGELLRIHWEGSKAIAGAHSKTIHDGSLEGLEGRHQQVGWFVPQPGGVAKHHFHWEKMGHIWNIVLSEVALRLMVCFEWLTRVCKVWFKSPTHRS